MNNALSALIRPHYLALQGYVSAGMEVQKSDDKVFLNANENPYELPGLSGFNRYPEPQPAALLAAMARAYDVKPDQIVLTRGADEAIVILTKLFCEPHQDSILICPPSFGMYGVNARAMPADVEEIPLAKENGTYRLDADRIVADVLSHGARIKLIYICSPNNPTGTSFPHAEIVKITRAVQGRAVVILDETYAEFSVQGSLSAQLEALPNLIILRTLSKSYAFAGMRVGCFLSGDRAFIALARAKCLDAYPLPVASVTAAIHVLSPKISALAHDNIAKILAERTRMEGALAASPHVVHVYPSDANFLLIEMKDAKDFVDHCARANVILRDFSGKAGTENCIRLSIGLRVQNDKVLELLAAF